MKYADPVFNTVAPKLNTRNGYKKESGNEDVLERLMIFGGAEASSFEANHQSFMLVRGNAT